MSAEIAPKIRILDENTINQIAAGEVVENSSSVIKELIENALDAGATEIELETKAGGRQLITVSDNGCGMHPQDLLLCIERHATSKISKADDLTILSTLGFRGEALPSIASISKLSIHTALENQEGNVLSVEGGKILHVKSFPRKRGTTVEVRSLFYNVPVRKKFQKSIAADQAEIHRLLLRISLCYPTLALKWINDEKTELHLPKNQLFEERATALLGEEFFQSLKPVDWKEKGKGWISAPSHHFPNRAHQFLFINGRLLHPKFLSQDVLSGYGSRLPPHRFPAFILQLQLPQDLIDINVHPQKSEVRLSLNCSWIAEGVEKALEEPQTYISFEEPQPNLFAEKTIIYEVADTKVASPKIQKVESVPFFDEQQITFLSNIGTFALLKEEDALIIFSAQAAQRRVFFEKALASSEKIGSQSLLFPYQLPLSSHQAEILCSLSPLLEECGFEGRFLSGSTWVLDALPAELEIEEAISLLSELLSEVKKDFKKEQLLLRVCKKISRKKRTEGEVKALYMSLQQCKLPHICPLGEATFVKWNETHLKKALNG